MSPDEYALSYIEMIIRNTGSRLIEVPDFILASVSKEGLKEILRLCKLCGVQIARIY